MKKKFKSSRARVLNRRGPVVFFFLIYFGLLGYLLWSWGKDGRAEEAWRSVSEQWMTGAAPEGLARADAHGDVSPGEANDDFTLLVDSAGEAEMNVPGAADTETVELRVVSWNIEWFPGFRPNANAAEARRHVEGVARALRQIDADIYLLQEVRNLAAVKAAFEGLPDYDVHLVTRLRNPDDQLSLQQLAIVSRLPAVAAFGEPFVSLDGLRPPPRGFAFASLELPDKSHLLIYNVHLKSNHGDAADNIRRREQSAHQMLRHAGEMERVYPGAKVLVGGDFNLLLDRSEMAHERTLEIFLDAGYDWGWEDVPFTERVTWPARNIWPDACFDHFISKGVVPVSSQVLQGHDALSDHRPVEHRILIEVPGSL